MALVVYLSSLVAATQWWRDFDEGCVRDRLSRKRSNSAPAPDYERRAVEQVLAWLAGRVDLQCTSNLLVKDILGSGVLLSTHVCAGDGGATPKAHKLCAGERSITELMAREAGGFFSGPYWGYERDELPVTFTSLRPRHAFLGSAHSPRAVFPCRTPTFEDDEDVRSGEYVEAELGSYAVDTLEHPVQNATKRVDAQAFAWGSQTWCHRNAPRFLSRLCDVFAPPRPRWPRHERPISVGLLHGQPSNNINHFIQDAAWLSAMLRHNVTAALARRVYTASINLAVSGLSSKDMLRDPQKTKTTVLQQMVSLLFQGATHQRGGAMQNQPARVSPGRDVCFDVVAQKLVGHGYGIDARGAAQFRDNVGRLCDVVMPRAPARKLVLAIHRGGRQFANESGVRERLFAWARARGIEAVAQDMGKLSACAQVKLLSDAKVYVGVHGAELGLLVFLPPGGVLIEASHPHEANRSSCSKPGFAGYKAFGRSATLLAQRWLARSLEVDAHVATRRTCPTHFPHVNTTSLGYHAPWARAANKGYIGLEEATWVFKKRNCRLYSKRCSKDIQVEIDISNHLLPAVDLAFYHPSFHHNNARLAALPRGTLEPRTPH